MTFIDFHLVVPGTMSVDAAHAICDHLEAKLREKFDQLYLTGDNSPASADYLGVYQKQFWDLEAEWLAELAGMVDRCDFIEQAHTPGEDQAVRPDMIVNMPDGRQIVVDVKTPLAALRTLSTRPGGAGRRGRGPGADVPAVHRRGLSVSSATDATSRRGVLLYKLVDQLFAVAATAPCNARNPRTGTNYRADLQGAIDAADPGEGVRGSAGAATAPRRGWPGGRSLPGSR